MFSFHKVCCITRYSTFSWFLTFSASVPSFSLPKLRKMNVRIIQNFHMICHMPFRSQNYTLDQKCDDSMCKFYTKMLYSNWNILILVVVIVYHVNIEAIGHGLFLVNFWSMVIGCTLPTEGSSII